MIQEYVHKYIFIFGQGMAANLINLAIISVNVFPIYRQAILRHLVLTYFSMMMILAIFHIFGLFSAYRPAALGEAPPMVLKWAQSIPTPQ